MGIRKALVDKQLVNSSMNIYPPKLKKIIFELSNCNYQGINCLFSKFLISMNIAG